jgi:Antitoxin MazE-like
VAISGRDKARAYRNRKREQGLRPVQIWVPDVRDPAFRERVRADVRALKKHPSSADANAFLDAALAEIEGWEA